MLTWLNCDVDQDDKSLINRLAVVCCLWDFIRSTTNFSEAWVHGSDNHRVSNIMHSTIQLCYNYDWHKQK